MSKLFRKLSMLLVTLLLTVGMSTFVYATDSEDEFDDKGTVTIEVNKKVEADIKSNKNLMLSLIENQNEYDRSIKDFSDSQIEKILLDVFTKNPELYKEQIENIDNEIENFRNSKTVSNKEFQRIKNQNSNSMVMKPQVINEQTLLISEESYNVSNPEVYVQGVTTGEFWVTDPKLVDSTDYVTYATVWLSANNYTCPTSVFSSTTERHTISKTIGFEGGGSLDATEALKFDLKVTASKTVSQTAEISESYEIPGWTIKGRRAYIEWTKETYEGKKCYYSIGPAGYFNTEVNEKATNSFDTHKSVQYWERSNANKNKNARAPKPPRGWYQ